MNQDIMPNINKNEEKKVMTITAEDGSIDQVEIIVAFEFTDLNKEYVVYTKNEVDANDNVTLYISSVVGVENGEAILGGIDTDEEWDRIKNVLRELAKDEPEVAEE